MKIFKLIFPLFMSLLVGSSQAASDAEKKKHLRLTLTPLQYKVTQEGGTEPPFKNEYWNHFKNGIYVDIISGDALFSSLDKFDSESGWPSFTRPLDDQHIELKRDFRFGWPRMEVIAKKSQAHLGHVFNDGPREKGGKRYCINSAALKFIPVKDMKAKGYEKYLKLFERP